MADIEIDNTSLMPKSGIPIAAGLENVYISIAGLIGAGKTTLATALGKVLGLPVCVGPCSPAEGLTQTDPVPAATTSAGPL